MKKHQFTLTELLTVIAIIAVLAGIAVPATISGLRKAARGEAKHDCGVIRLALEQYLNTYGSFRKLGIAASSETIGSDSYSFYAFDTSAGDIMDALTGTKGNSNNRGIKFLDKRPEATDSEWLDPWDNPYHVRLALPGSDEVPWNGKVLNGRVFVYSDGMETAAADYYDDIKSWGD